MDDLNPKARALVQAGRAALGARNGDRERIEAQLRERLGPSALPPETGVARIAGAAGRRVAARLAVGAVVVVVGVGSAFLALRPGADATLQAARSAQSEVVASRARGGPARLDAQLAVEPAPASSAEAPLTDPTQAVAGTVHGPSLSPATSKRRGGSVRHAPDRLAQEVALLSRATAALRAGHAANALEALDEHLRKFPDGALGEERRTAKAQALCLLGRITQGRAELARLPPESPAAARAQQVCSEATRAPGSP